MGNKSALQSYIENNWSSHYKTITELSRPSGTEQDFIVSDKKLLCYDDITKEIWEGMASADALSLNDGVVEFIEYKTGLKRKTPVQYDPKLAKCPHAGHEEEDCKEYWSILVRLRKSEVENIFYNIKQKAVDSYLSFCNCVLQECSIPRESLKINLTVVVDVEPIEEHLAILADAAKKDNENVDSSVLADLNMSLGKYRKQKNGRPVFYDRVEVLGAKQYLSRLS